MKGSHDPALKHSLKQMILEVCDKDIGAESVGDDEPLFGDEAALQLDSLDGLQISMEIQKRFGQRISDPKELRRILTSINNLADYLRPA